MSVNLQNIRDISSKIINFKEAYKIWLCSYVNSHIFLYKYFVNSAYLEVITSDFCFLLYTFLYFLNF